jgi:plasmid stabilization system protein ParE
MALLKVFWTETAINLRNHVFEYWNDRNKSTEYSKRLRLKINNRIETLKKQPKSGKQTDFKDVRIVSLGHYSILYKFDETKITIVAFWDNRQDPKKLLIFLKGE